MINTSKIYRNVLLITQQGRQPSLRWMTIFLEFKKGPVITLRIYFVSTISPVHFINEFLIFNRSTAENYLNISK